MNKLIDTFEQILQFDVIVLYVNQFIDEKNRLIENFNIEFQKIMILIIIYKVAEIKLNLQNMCFHVYLYEQLCDFNVRDQVFTQCRRLKNFNTIIYVYNYYIDGIICSQIITRKIDKCILNAAAHLNNDVLNFIVEIKTNFCVIYDNRIISMNDEKIIDLKLLFAKLANIVL